MFTLDGVPAGWIKLPLPYPAVEQYAHPVPPHIYPWKAQPLDKVWVTYNVICRYACDVEQQHEQQL
jgi:hypothetical protein